MKIIVRALLAVLALGASALVYAQSFPTITPLQVPTEVSAQRSHGCIAGGFNADDSVYGACSYVLYGACSGRACQPVRYTHNYIVAWDLNGNVTNSVACDIVRTHVPQVPQYTYLNGYTYCPGYAANPLQSVTYVPYGPYSWEYNTFYFVAISDDGLYTLIDNGIVYPATAQVHQS